MSETNQWECDWRQIDSAPKDGSLLLLCMTPHRGYLDAPMKVGGWWQDQWNVFGGSWTPTHWLPLPMPPSPVTLNDKG
jgi:hypothetical protein